MRIDVDVSISMSAQAGRAGDWFPLLYVVDEAATATIYKEYSSMEEIVKDFTDKTPAYTVANLMFMQGSDYMCDKVAIVKGTDTVFSNLTLYMNKNWRHLITVNKEFDATLAASIEDTDKVYFTHFASIEALKTAKITEYEKTFAVVYKGEDVTNPEAALVGRTAGLTAGSFTYHSKVLKGVTADTFTATELKEIVENGGNAYVMKNGRIATHGGVVGNGEYLDIVDSKDYIVQNIGYDVQEVFLNNEKIAYTNAGISKIETAVRNVLARAYNNNMIATNDDGTAAYSTNFKLRNETTTEDRLSREYPYGGFEFELAGAVHHATIKGNIVA
jgi:hypothetical protein